MLIKYFQLIGIRKLLYHYIIIQAYCDIQHPLEKDNGFFFQIRIRFFSSVSILELGPNLMSSEWQFNYIDIVKPLFLFIGSKQSGSNYSMQFNYAFNFVPGADSNQNAIDSKYSSQHIKTFFLINSLTSHVPALKMINLENKL